LKKTGESRSKLVKEYSNQLSDLESLHKDVTKKIEKSQSEQLKLQKELEKVADQQGKSQAEVEDQQAELEALSASDDPDKEPKIAEIGVKIKALQAANTGAMTRISELESERSQLEVEQQPFEDKVTRLADQIITVEVDQKEALAPLVQKIAQLEATIQEKKNAIEALEQEIAPKALALGPSVEAARPKSEALSGLYKKIDETKADLGEASQELHLVAARLETCDQGAVRNFYWMVAGILLLVVLSVIFFILAFV